MSTAARRTGASPDPIRYPVDEPMGEGLFQKLVIAMLLPLVQRWLDARGKVALVGGDQFIYWVQFDPTTCLAPDLYVLPGVPPGTEVECWKVWETGVTPSFALEVVSDDRLKDYERSPGRYDELGVRELLVFDRHHRRRDHVRWQAFRRTKRRGLVRVEATDADRIYSHELGCWLRAVGAGYNTRLRVATGPDGDELFPTEAEAAESARKIAEARVAELEAELAALRGRRPAPRRR